MSDTLVCLIDEVHELRWSGASDTPIMTIQH